MENIDTVSLEDADKQEDVKLSPLVGLIESRLNEWNSDRNTTEIRWQEAYENFRGHYNNRVKFTSTEKSRAFVKITKTKVMAAYGQILEILLAQNKLPITIQPTILPDGIAGKVHIDGQKPSEEAEDAPEEPSDPFGYEGDGNDLKAGDTLLNRLGSTIKKIYDGAIFKEGAGDSADDVNLNPAEIAAAKMQRKIDDQLEESHAIEHVCKAVFESVLLGTGVLKGPFLKSKEYPRWTEEGEYDPLIKTVPEISQVSVWDFYTASTNDSAEDVDESIERHRMTKTGLRALKKRPFFRETAIDEAIEYGPSVRREWWETELKESDLQVADNRYEVLEYWGMMDVAFLEDELDEKLPKNLKNEEEVMVNAWICNGCILRVALNPFKPNRNPYHVFNFEEDLYNFWGVGVAENMQDAQTLMNGFARLAIDNAVLAGNMMIEVDESNLVPGQSMEVSPGKIWRRQGGAPGQAIFGVKWPSTSNENMQMFDKWRQLADESTGIPSFSHGQTGVSGIGRTASGISMLMGAANLSTKTAMKNIDSMLKSLGEALFAFNMQFDPDPEIKGDLEVKASGPGSLIAKEVLAQKLGQVLQLALNPSMAPIANISEAWKSYVEALGLDKDLLTLSPEQAAVQAKLLAKTSPEAPANAQAAMQNPAMANQPLQAGPPSIDAAQNGGGNIAPADPSLEQNMPQQ